MDLLSVIKAYMSGVDIIEVEISVLLTTIIHTTFYYQHHTVN